MESGFEFNTSISSTAATCQGSATQAAEERVVALSGSATHARIAVADELRMRADRPTVDALIDALADVDPQVCRAAAEALGQLHDPRAIGPLTGVLKDGRRPDDVRWAAAQALRTLGALRARAQDGATDMVDQLDESALDAEPAHAAAGHFPPKIDVASPAHSSAPRGTVARRWFIVVVVVLLLLAVAGYYYRGANLADQAQAAYTRGDCDTVLAIDATIVAQYPAAIAPYADTSGAPAAACRAFGDAMAQQATGDWPAAHQAYTTFLSIYPDTPLSAAAREQLTETIFAWADQQRRAGDEQGALDTYALLDPAEPAVVARRYQAEAATYAEWSERRASAGDYAAAVQYLKTLLRSYSDAEATKPAAARIVKVWLEWGARLRADGSYPSADQVYADLIGWASERRDQTTAAAAQTEQAQLYRCSPLGAKAHSL